MFLSRQRWLIPPRPLVTREYRPVLEREQLTDLRRRIKQNMSKWKEEEGTKATVKSKDDSGDRQEDKVLEKDLEKDRQKLDKAMKKEKRMQKVESLAEQVANYMPKLPFYVSNLVGRKPDVPDGTTFNNGGSEERETPFWKLHLGPASGGAVSKSAVDERTRFCVANLRKSDPNNGEQCLRRLETFCGHLHKYPWAKGVAVRENAIGELLLMRLRLSVTQEQSEAVQIQIRETLGLLGYQSPIQSRGIRILSLDGGGMRGIVALEVLRKLERLSGKRIVDMFDFICGVSTGSIIASFLAFHKKSVDQVESVYEELGTKIFQRNLLRGATGWVVSHSYYDSEAYEEILQSFVGETRMSDTIRSTTPTPKVAIVSTLVSEDKVSPYVFRNYHYPHRSQSFYRGSARFPIWAAVRASSAAPGYFDEFVLNGKIHHDGGMLTNNATLIAVHEAQRLWPNDSIQCVVSLGMGRHERPIASVQQQAMADAAVPTGNGISGPIKSLSLAQKFSRIVDAATDTEIAHVALHDLLPGSVYYRFNPALSECFPLDETRPEKIAQMREDTQMYLRRNHNRLIEACEQIALKRRPWDVVRDYAGDALAMTKARL